MAADWRTWPAHSTSIRGLSTEVSCTRLRSRTPQNNTWREVWYQHYWLSWSVTVTYSHSFPEKSTANHSVTHTESTYRVWCKTIVTTFFIKQVTIVLLIWPITQTLYTTVNIQVMYLYSVCAEYWPDALGYRHDGSPVSLVGCCGHLQHWQIFTHHVSKWRQLKTRASIHRMMYNLIVTLWSSYRTLYW